MSQDQFKQILDTIEPCQYSNTDLVVNLLHDLTKLRNIIESECREPALLFKFDLALMSLELIDSQNSQLEVLLTQYRRLKA